MSPLAPEPTVVWDAQGTPRSPRFNDIYRSQGLDGQGGLAQSRHVFLQGCGLLGPQALWRGQPHWTILETGFGLGLNFLAAWAAWRADPQRPRHLHFVSVEAYPVTADDLVRSASPWPDLLPLAEALAQRWWGVVEGVHRWDLDDAQVHLTLGVGPADQRLPALSLQADSVFLDGFSPDTNPDVWSPAVLSQVAAHCRTGTRLATWTVTRPVRSTLSDLGFELERVAGLPPKRHALTGSYRPRVAPPVEASSHNTASVEAQPSIAACATLQRPEPVRCAVVGAGLAGAAIARALAERGWAVEVFEAGPSACSGASGLPAGLCAPHVSQDDSWLSRLTRAGVRATSDQAQRLLRADQDFGQTGVLERRLLHKTRKARLPQHWPDAAQAWSRLATPTECRDTFRQTHLPIDEPTPLWHPSGLWLKPASLVRGQLQHANIRLHVLTPVLELRQAPSRSTRTHWQLKLNTGWTDSFDQVVLCAGPATHDLLRQILPPERLPTLTPVRGQLSWGRVDAALQSVLPAGPVNGDGSFLGPIPTDDGPLWMAGSTFDRSRQSAVLDDRDETDNLHRLQGLLPDVAAVLLPRLGTDAIQGWAAVRCTTPDRLPRVGAPWPEQAPGLHVLTGLGARGLTLSVLCGQWLAARLNGEPSPLELDLSRRLAADRS